MIPSELLAALPRLAVRALAESALVGAFLAGIVWLVVEKFLPMRAAARHTVWSLALLAIAILPVASIVSSLAHVRYITAATTTSDAVPVHPHRGNVGSTSISTAATSAATTLSAPAPRLPTITIPESIAIGALVIWATGAAIGFAMLIASVLRVQGLKRRSSPLEGSLAGELPWLTDVRAREIYLRLSYEIETPVAIGFGRPVILIPTELATHEGLGAIESLVMHEHAHLRRYDDYTNFAQRVVERLFWFNPVVWLVGKRIALEREIASDDCVVAQTGHPQEYAESLWRLAKEMRMPEHAIVAPGALLTRKQITVRIEQLLDARRDLRPRLSAPALATLGLGSALAILTMSVSAPAIELTSPADPPTLAHAKLQAHPSATTIPAPNFIVGDTRKSIALQELPTTPLVVAEPRSAPTPLTPGQRQALQHIQDVAREHRGADTRILERKIVILRGQHPDKIELEQSIRKLQQKALVDTSVASAALAAAAEAMAATPTIPPLGVAPVPEPAPSASLAPRSRTIVIRPSIPELRVELPDGNGPLRQLRLHKSAPLGGPIPAEVVIRCLGCDFHGRDLSGINLAGKSLTGINLRGADLSGANLNGSTLTGVDLRGAALQGADLRNARLFGTSLIDVNLEGAQLGGVKLSGSEIGRVHLSEGQYTRDLLHDCSGCDLRNANLRNADLHGIRLSGADFRGADLGHADLRDAHLSGADLRSVNLAGADLRGAQLIGCDMNGTNLKGANVTGASFTGSDMSRATF